jgi:hypothetical protein
VDNHRVRSLDCTDRRDSTADGVTHDHGAESASEVDGSVLMAAVGEGASTADLVSTSGLVPAVARAAAAGT